MKRRHFYIIMYLVAFVGIGSYNFAQTESEIEGMDSFLFSNDSTYHAGALIALDTHEDLRKLKSTFCLSCHDGVFAPQGHTTTNFGNPETIDPTSIFSFNHPVAFEFSSSLAFSKSYLNDPYTTPSGLGGTIAQDLLVNGYIECVTCHNIFFNPKDLEKYEILNLKNSGSQLCLTCHNR